MIIYRYGIKDKFGVLVKISKQFCHLLKPFVIDIHLMTSLIGHLNFVNIGLGKRNKYISTERCPGEMLLDVKTVLFDEISCFVACL